ncbi:MAG: serine/threonine protein kinase [Planctomycetes bacterium]|nr:serine/threonine protein kinase [Planctomycetota bacterium]
MCVPKLDSYKISSVVHKGRASIIYKAKDRKSGRIVAIKHVCKEVERADKYFKHIRNEFEIGTHLLEEVGDKGLHPSIIRMYDLISRRRLLMVHQYNLVMEFVEGKNLQQHSDYPIKDILDIYLQMAKSMRFLHAYGYVHADMKPSNVIIMPGLQVKLIDFGLSCRTGSKITSIRGTRDFMAPEQVERGVIDERTDVYNLGATIYRVLTGRPLPALIPADDDETLFITSDRVKADPIRFSNPNVPKPLEAIVMQSCERKRDKRPESMTKVINALEGIRASLFR